MKGVSVVYEVVNECVCGIVTICRKCTNLNYV